MLEKLSIGLDIVNVNRFREIPFLDNKKFYTRIFTDNEINYCLKFGDPFIHFAGKFALKESLIKCIKQKQNFLDIETSHINNQPIITLKNCINQKYDFKASISHEYDFAIGIVLAEKIS